MFGLVVDLLKALLEGYQRVNPQYHLEYEHQSCLGPAKSEQCTILQLILGGVVVYVREKIR